MKTGTHLGAWMNRWDENIVPYAEKAAALGFDAVEISLLDLDKAGARELGRTLAALGLEVTCTTGLGPESDITSDDVGVRKAGVETLYEAIDITAALGSSLLSGVIFSAWGKCTQERRNERRKRSVEGLRAAGARAAENGIRLGIEAINRYETDLVNTSLQARELADEVGLPAVGILLDTYHMNIEEKDPGAAIRTAGDRLFHLHCVENDRGVPGTGSIDWSAIAAALRSVGYGGFLTLEMFIQSNRPVSPDLFVWRDIESDPDDANARAIAFLKELTA